MRKAISSFLLFVGISVSVFSQSAKIDSLKTMYDNMYGLDMLLHNGRKYFSEVNPKEGYPFWQSNEAFIADLFIQGERFMNQRIQYDIFSQKIILSYSDYSGYHYPIVLTNSIIDSIKISDVVFVKSSFSKIQQPFIQRIYSGSRLACYVGSYKKEFSNFEKDKLVINISNELRDFYLIHDGELQRLQRRSSLLEIFEKKQRKKIKKYMVSNRIRFKKIDNQQLEKLIRYSESTMY